MEIPGPWAGDVLAQPTRARLFELLQELKRETSNEELAERLGLHVNGIRRQLERLQEAGLVERHKRRHGRGRPRDLWAIAAEANPGGERPRAYDDLAGWLASAIPAGPGRLREVKRTGQEIGRALAPADSDGSARAFEQVLSALGFQPQVGVGEGDAVCCRLGNCPYKEAVQSNQAVVCTLHEGITAGLLERLAPQASLSRFEPHDPDQAGCLIEVTGAGWTEPAAAPDPAPQA
jgi:predicted ArsR family transcriptional regulator